LLLKTEQNRYLHGRGNIPCRDVKQHNGVSQKSDEEFLTTETQRSQGATRSAALDACHRNAERKKGNKIQIEEAGKSKFKS
jgi:hypothetical protein